MILRAATVAAIVAMTAALVSAQTTSAPSAEPGGLVEGVTKMLPDTSTPEGGASLIKWALLLTVLSVAPAVLVMVTCFTRIIVVLGLLRQALGTHQLPPNQVLFALAMLLSVVVMAPTFQAVHRDAIGPYMEGKIDQTQALRAGEAHVRTFMSGQIEDAGNTGDVYLFLDDELAGKEGLAWGEVPTMSLIPAFVISELKVAFMMGFRIFLPFLVIDMLVASVLVSMGMLMVPPALVSLPFKLLLFVLADGWHLVVGTLMASFA